MSVCLAAKCIVAKGLNGFGCRFGWHPSTDPTHKPQTASGIQSAVLPEYTFRTDRQTTDGIGDSCVPRALTLYYIDSERRAENLAGAIRTLFRLVADVDQALDGNAVDNM